MGQDGNEYMGQNGNGYVSQGGNGYVQQGGNGYVSQGGNGYVQQGGNGYVSQGGNGYVQQGWNGYMPQQGDVRVLQGDELKAARKHFLKLGGGFLVGSMAIFLIQILAVKIADTLSPELVSDMNIYLLVSMLPMYLIGIPFLALLVWRLPSQVPEKRVMKPGQFAVSVIMAFALMYIANIAGTILTTVIGFFKRDVVQNTIANVVTETNTLTVFFIMVICAPIVEEFVFRKLVVDRAARYGQGTAVVLSGLMFGLFHGNLNQFMYATALGMFLAFLYVKTGKLKITIAIHMLINFMGSIVSAWVLKLADLEAVLGMDTSDMSQMMEYMSENMLGYLVYLLYAFCVFGIMIAGFVLLIVFAAKKRFAMRKGPECIPKGKRFLTVILNIGMGLYFVFWIGMIINQLFA